ncbi:MAG: hypothetical protein ACFB0G_05940 [Leptolyngbyaceae cyanobacterium]
MKLDESVIAALGGSLRPINPNLMKAAEDNIEKRRIWYQGQEPYFDVTIEMIGETITWFQVTLRSKVVSWRSPSSLQTGETDEMDVPPDVGYYAASKTIRDGALINWPLVESIAKILAQKPDDPLLVQASHLLQQQLTARPENS